MTMPTMPSMPKAPVRTVIPIANMEAPPKAKANALPASKALPGTQKKSPAIKPPVKPEHPLAKSIYAPATQRYAPQGDVSTVGIMAPQKPKPMEGLRRTTDVALDPDGQRRYLKETDYRSLTLLNELEYPTTRHMALFAGSSPEYYVRRLKQFHALNLVQQAKDPIGLTGWSLKDKGHVYIGHQLPATKLTPHDLNHAHREILNTLLIKLMVGVDEPILFSKSPGYKNAPLPILTKRWLNLSAQQELALGDIEERIATNKERLLNDSLHPTEQHAEFDIKKGVLPQEMETLLAMYKTQESAFLFNEYSDGETDATYGVHAVILRPNLCGRRGDGRMTDPAFNHDGLRVENRLREIEFYQYMLWQNFTSGLYGRLHVFTDSVFIQRNLLDSMDYLIQRGDLPRGSESWLHVNKLPQAVNNTGKGKDKYDEEGLRRMRSHYDG